MAPVAPLFTPYRPTRTRQESHAPSLNGDRQSGTAPGDQDQNMAAIGFGGEVHSPQAPVLKCGCLPEPVKSAYGVAARWATPTPDRTRPTGAGSGAGDDEHQGDKPEPLVGSHAGSHTDERPCDSPNSRGQRTRTHPRSRTDPNWRGCLYRNLRIRRLGVRVPPSAPRSKAGYCTVTGLLCVRVQQPVQQPAG